jgi:WD40 repeat protein
LQILNIHQSPVYCLQVLDRELVSSGAKDKLIKIWNVNTGQVLKVLEGHTERVVSLKLVAKNLLVSGSEDECLKVWDLVTVKCVRTSEAQTPQSCCWGFLVDNDQKGRLISGYDDGIVRIWTP